MCGIAGIMTRGGVRPDAAVLDALADALAHRGPDGRGRALGGSVGLVQTRLAIIDLETGGQPFFDSEGRALVANGEIYNHVELRDSLADTAFASASDCEPPLHLYRRSGLAFTERLRGMYAIALHDPAAGGKPERLVLARDPFGIKPLYYAETEAGFGFASEPQALVAAGLAAPLVNETARSEVLQLQFSTGSECLFAGIRRVLPGETLVIEDGRVTERRRRPALPQGGPLDRDEAEALRDLDAALEDSVGLHQRSDVPYGMFLSGGIDSSALLVLMARLNERPVLAFTAHFPGTGVHDEREAARAVARAAGAEHVEVPFSEADFWRILPQAAAAMDDPAADYAILPTFLLAEEARKSVKVILSGEGGDELFGGYGRYRAAIRPWPLARRMRRKGTFDGLDVLRDPPSGWRDGIAAAERAEAAGGRTRLQTIQATDCADWLPNDLLTKLDRCLMAHGVEGRVPFLDPVVADLAFRLPDRLKVRGSLGKWLLRRWLRDRSRDAGALLPKRGFTVPVGEWIAARASRLAPLVAARPCIAGLCRPGAIEPLFAAAGKGREGFAAWTLLFYALWHRRHMEGREPNEDVFESLAD
ncbi:MAG: asparagine synthase (glutamine-hydrolyzing) [Alphaproteobacteria bacterium]|nr:asparagine synthase (glutamine-hydrolyzing) [Alphaproteobacteria bacterium]